MVEQFNDLYSFLFPYLLDTVVTDPPMERLDWRAFEAWENAHGIYRINVTVNMDRDGLTPDPID